MQKVVDRIFVVACFLLLCFWAQQLGCGAENAELDAPKPPHVVRPQAVIGLSTPFYSKTPIPVFTSGVLKGLKIAAIAANGDHSLLVSQNGTMFSFGKNDDGQLGDGTSNSRYLPVEVSNETLLGVKIISASAGKRHSLALSDSGQIYSFGNNDYGQLGDGTNTDSLIPTKVVMSQNMYGMEAIQIAAGYLHSLALTSSGVVFAFGNNGYGQLGTGGTQSRNTPYPVLLGSTFITAIAAGDYHSMVLSSTGTVYTFGSNSAGQLGVGSSGGQATSPVSVDGITGDVIAIAAGKGFSLVATTSDTYSFGANNYGQLGDGTTTNRSTPVGIDLHGVKSLCGGGRHSIFMTQSSDELLATGDNSDGQLGAVIKSYYERSLVPVSIDRSGALSPSIGIEAIAAGESHSLVLGSNGRVYSFGANIFGQLGASTEIDFNVTLEVALITGFTLAAGATWIYIVVAGLIEFVVVMVAWKAGVKFPAGVILISILFSLPFWITLISALAATVIMFIILCVALTFLAALASTRTTTRVYYV